MPNIINQTLTNINYNNKMAVLDDLPDVESMLGIELQTASMIIAALGIVHPMAYGCTFFMPISYLIVTIWILVTLYFALSVILLCSLTREYMQNDSLLCTIWIWYALVFVGIMLLMLILLGITFILRRQKNRVLVVILGMLWYILTIYFILVVNSYRKRVESQTLPQTYH